MKVLPVLEMILLCVAFESSASVAFYADNFQSYPVSNPAPNPLTNGPAGGQWYFLNPLSTGGIVTDEHRIYQTTAAGSGCNSLGWISDANNAGLSNSIVVTALPQNTNVATFTLSWLAATDTSTTNRDCTFFYQVAGSAGTLRFLSGSNLDDSQLLSGLGGYAIAKAGNFGKGPSRRFQLAFTATNLAVGDTINFSVTRITNSLAAGAFIFLDDVSLAVDLGPPILVRSPSSATRLEDSSVTLTAMFSNSVDNYQWYRDGSPIAGATNDSYTIASVTTNDAGSYMLRATNSSGAASTLPALLKVVSVPDIYAWFRGDSGLAIGADSYSVITWTNFGFAATNNVYTEAGRNLVNLTGAPQKLYLRTAEDNPAGAIAFSGGDGIWATKGSFGILTNNYTIIAYARIRDAATEGFLFDGTSLTPGDTRALVWSNNWRVSVTSGAGTITTSATTNVWQIHSFVIGTNTGSPLFQHFINSQEAGDMGISSPVYLSGLMVGANVSQALGIRADVAEFIVFNSALDPMTRSKVESYLSSKWEGVTADASAPPPPPPYIYTPVFVSGATNGFGVTNGIGYPEYRIPAMVTTINGTVIAVADGRQGNGDIPNPIDCVCRRSFDNGGTWGSMQIIADYGSNRNSDDADTYPAYGITNSIPRACAGDASLLLDRSNGRVWVLYDNGAPAVGKLGGRAIKLEMRYSDDNGETWSSRIDVEALNSDLRPTLSAAPEFLTGPGNGIQLISGTNAGRLVFPVYIYGGPYYSSVIYSDDHGQTWKMGGNCGTGGGEIQIVETPNGGLLASMRDNNFPWNGVRTFSRSTDGGINWSAPFTNMMPAMADPQCQGSILRLTWSSDRPANPSSRIVFANCNSSSSRRAMTLRISYDEGKTWPVTNLVYSGASGYSALTKLANGQVGLLNEVNNFARIDFVSRSVSDISNGADTNQIFLNMSIAPMSGAGPLSLFFLTQSNNAYTLQYCTNLSVGGWRRFMDFAAQPGDAEIELPLEPTNRAQFFRLITPQAP